MTQEQTSAAPLESGREALRRHAWGEAYDLLSEAGVETLTAADLEGLSRAAWFTGRLDQAISASERAFAGHLAENRKPRAALVALWLVKDNFMKGATSVAAAWLKRAESLLSDEPECVEHGYFERLQAMIAFEGEGDPEKALSHAERALQIANRFGDRDLQAMALQDCGRVLVELGDLQEGMKQIDEASVAAVSGELSPMTTGVVYCNTIVACEHIADYGRAGEWTEMAERWCERQGVGGFPGICRVHRAGIIRRRGDWPEAEAEARRACDELGGFYVTGAAEAFYELGVVHSRMGDLERAEESFQNANELGRLPQPGMALVRLAQGRIEAARSSIERALSEESRELHRARLLPARIEIALALDELEPAKAAADELEGIAAKYATPALRAMAAWARGALDLADDQSEEASDSFRQAVRLWQEVGAPYEAARALLDLAAAYRAFGDRDAAVLEAKAARSVFERLGAAADVHRANNLLAADRHEVTRTFLFTDIVDSTALLEAIGDEAWAGLSGWHDQALRSLFSAHGGEEVDHAGDGFFVTFPDEPSAFDCAIAIQRRLAEHRREHGFAPQVRMGIHSAAATKAGAGYRGRGVNAAARIAALAAGGEILASRATAERADGSFDPSRAREVRLKGIAEPVEVVSVGWR